jgi:undecaprenyl pyrophosphate phosphatase UppP
MFASSKLLLLFRLSFREEKNGRTGEKNAFSVLFRSSLGFICQCVSSLFLKKQVQLVFFDNQAIQYILVHSAFC